MNYVHTSPKKNPPVSEAQRTTKGTITTTKKEKVRHQWLLPWDRGEIP